MYEDCHVTVVFALKTMCADSDVNTTMVRCWRQCNLASFSCKYDSNFSVCVLRKTDVWLIRLCGFNTFAYFFLKNYIPVLKIRRFSRTRTGWRSYSQMSKKIFTIFFFILKGNCQQLLHYPACSRIILMYRNVSSGFITCICWLLFGVRDHWNRIFVELEILSLLPTNYNHGIYIYNAHIKRTNYPKNHAFQLKAKLIRYIPVETAAIFFLANICLEQGIGYGIDFIWMGLLDLWGAQTENHKMKNSW